MFIASRPTDVLPDGIEELAVVEFEILWVIDADANHAPGRFVIDACELVGLGMPYTVWAFDRQEVIPFSGFVRRKMDLPIHNPLFPDTVGKAVHNLLLAGRGVEGTDDVGLISIETIFAP